MTPSEDTTAAPKQIDLARALHRAAWGFVILACAVVAAGYVQIARSHPDSIGNDAIIYFRATAEWLRGGDPWSVTRDGTTFGGIPPTLILSLPLQPFGEEFARWFWPVSGTLAMVLVVRRYGLSLLWLAWPPFLEGAFRGAVDYTLLGLVATGGGAITALTKPYAAPLLLWERRWAAFVAAGLVAVASFPLLPWPQFISNWTRIEGVIAPQSSNLSAWGHPALMVAAGIALLSLRRDGLILATPALWPHAQLHYSIFSIRIAAASPILALGLAMPIVGAAPAAVVVYAIWRLIDRGGSARVANHNSANGGHRSPVR